MVGICPGGYLARGLLSGGNCPGVIVRGICLGGICPDIVFTSLYYKPVFYCVHCCAEMTCIIALLCLII